jgi:putative ABC transport system permease protein
LDATDDLVDRYLPRLRRKVRWEETKWTVLVIGVGRERILNTSVSPDAPLVDAVAPGRCAVGYEIHHALELVPGDTIDILDRGFEIERCKPESGTKDDITIWLHLSDAQELLGLPGKVNEILFVEHLSVWGRLQEVQRRFAAVLPECQVVEMASETLSRAHARVKVSDEAEAAVRRERERQAELGTERNRIVRAVLPPGVLVCALWAGGWMYWNVRDRRQELGVLMAQGFQASSVRLLILSKALLLGIAGGALGFVLGAATAVVWESWCAAGGRLQLLAGARLLGLAIATSAAVCVLGSWLPASLAVRTDPATVLRQE